MVSSKILNNNLWVTVLCVVVVCGCMTSSVYVDQSQWTFPRYTGRQVHGYTVHCTDRLEPSATVQTQTVLHSVCGYVGHVQTQTVLHSVWLCRSCTDTDCATFCVVVWVMYRHRLCYMLCGCVGCVQTQTVSLKRMSFSQQPLSTSHVLPPDQWTNKYVISAYYICLQTARMSARVHACMSESTGH